MSVSYPWYTYTIMGEKKLWFRAKTYGWGWTPSSWEGWVVLLVWAVFFAWNTYRLMWVSESDTPKALQLIVVNVLSVSLLLFICYRTGEKPHWQWGRKKDNK